MSLALFLGEAFLLGALFYGLFWAQGKYHAEFKSLEEERRRYMAFYENRNNKFLELYNSWIRNQTISKATLTELNEIDKGSISLFETPANRPIPAIYSQTMYMLMIAGTIILFSSFLI